MFRLGRLTGRSVAWCLALASATAWASAQSRDAEHPPLVISSMYGRDLYQFYCATCHGLDGRGDGPSAKALRVPPADLTRLALDNGGTFPRSRVESVVSGGLETVTPVHGSREMPVWGPIFRGLDRDAERTRIRIANIVGYLESIQRTE